MNFLKKIRKYSFWVNDYLNGSPIRKHYEDIKFILENDGSVESENRIDYHLLKLLEHARLTSSYYSKNAITNRIEDFPIINKNIVLENFESFKSTAFTNKKKVQVSTNGSTGTPFKLYHNIHKRNRHSADNLYYAEKGGYELGDKLYLLRALHKKDSKSLLRFFKQNFKAYGILNYSDNDLKKLLNDFMKGSSEKCIVCFASMCEIIVNYLDSNNIAPFKEKYIKSIVTDGDALSKSTKDKMEKYFGIPVYARYGNMECGVMAQQGLPNGYQYNLNRASYYFEILNIKDDKPVKPGEIGRIVVTDLFNYSMPLIRYDTGDMARLAFNNSGSKSIPVFDRIDGRIIDIIWNTNGKIISPYLIYTITEKYNELKQFQFAQTDKKKYVYRLNPWGDFFSKENELILISKKYLGEDADITIEYVEEVPLLASKKRKPVINEYI